MLIAASLIAAFNILLGIASFLTKQKRKNWEQENVVYLPFYIAGVGIVCGTILSIPTVVCAIDGDWMFAFFGVVVLVCDCMMAAYLNCVIRYDDKGFIAQNIFGIKRECSYGDVEGIRSGRDRRIYFQGHSIMIDEISCGADEFVDALDKGHKRATGKWVPSSTSFRRKWDPMNGHLDYPWAYFILWVTMGLFCAALPVFMFFVMTSETDPSDMVIFGDRLYTDIALGKRNGVTSVLVLSGETKQADVDKADDCDKPDFVAPSLLEVNETMFK
jgi:hypothetical protein